MSALMIHQPVCTQCQQLGLHWQMVQQNKAAYALVTKTSCMKVVWKGTEGDDLRIFQNSSGNGNALLLAS